MKAHRKKHKAESSTHPVGDTEPKNIKESADVLPFTHPYPATTGTEWIFSNWPFFTWPLHILNFMATSWQQQHALFFPRTESHEDNSSYFYTAELPGVSHEDIALNIRDHTIIMSVDRSRQNPYFGYPFGRDFERAFPIPIRTNGKHISASLKNGLLTITIPKSEHHTEAVSDTIPID